MRKKIRFNTISLGSEPDQPDIDELIPFIRTMRDQEADLISFYLARSLELQLEAGITSPGAGGRFMQSRFQDAIICSSDGYQTNLQSFATDARMMTLTAGPVRSILPGPGLIPGSPDPEDEEQYADYSDAYTEILRTMRDNFISGHLLHVLDVCPIDEERIASQKTTFVVPDGNIDVQSRILEFQSRIALTSNRTGLLDELMDQYDIRTLFLIDPDEKGYKKALEHLDPEQITLGGYACGSEDQYWKDVAGAATTTISQG
ncbi:MAG: hypothetical protein LUQ50_14625 [Methanospirillum sp.]|uniref:hypothetical protein n=1 Tax=Methanospirillum sp. TaxID=45200 RepID=UPI00236AFF73|nr:hypothetical protein [Methanospirillum sp.]MDD1730287.1 hypothetical protein [Methanospirillum sp.]